MSRSWAVLQLILWASHVVAGPSALQKLGAGTVPCRWREAPGQYLRGFATANLSIAHEDWDEPAETQVYVSLQSAKAACEALGTLCSGVTSAVAAVSYTTRRGGLFDSLDGLETSHVKEVVDCGVVLEETLQEVGEQQLQETLRLEITEQEEHQGDFIECVNGERLRVWPDVKAEEEVVDEKQSDISRELPPRCMWQQASNYCFLPGHAGTSNSSVGTGFVSLEAAKRYCEVLGRSCTGITFQHCPPHKMMLFTPRSSPTPRRSNQQEFSWFKYCDNDADLWPDEQVIAANIGPPSTRGCAEHVYASYRNGAMKYYETSTTPHSFYLNHDDTYRRATDFGWTEISAECVPAALQCILLSIEESLFTHKQVTADLMQAYINQFHAALVSDHVSTKVLDDWPLKAGWKRITRLRAEMNASQARALAYPRGNTVDFVLCYCGVPKARGPGLPKLTDDVSWLVELLRLSNQRFRSRTRIFIKEKCGEDAFAVRSDEALRVMLLTVADVVEVELVHDELRADDSTAYFAHLAGKYDDLAEWTFFLHADAPEHVYPMVMFEDVLAALRGGTLDSERFPFLYLTNNYLEMEQSRLTWDNYSSPAIWKEVFGGSFAPPRSAVKGYCCVQFLVPRRRALLRPQPWYERALHWFGSVKSYTSLFPVGHMVHLQDVCARVPAQYWMAWWHVVFGEELACPQRHEDPRLPLFVQFRRLFTSHVVK
eukprot:TRINITY_DN49080_c0_g1_i1.p1 TRINITY_DN49080_c0_g1~~TRINITY_DN49080_c0_g1_i1.p1  ORF type:complete len:770 (-),score=102.63 TRINITY_DN49080_c0_g1_i1:263-2401(-)